MKYRFSVVIPSFNRAGVILNCIESVLSQTEQSFEIIVVDDGSKDNTREVLEKIQDPRVRYVYQENGGGSKARNTGISVAEGKYVAFLDSDDVYLSHHLEQAFKFLEKGENNCTYTQVIVDRGDDVTFLKPPRALREGENVSEYLICNRGFIQTSTLIVPNTLAKKVLFDEDLSFGQDTDFAIRLAHQGARFIMMREPGVIWDDRWSPKRVSSKIDPEQRERWLKRNKEILTEKSYKSVRGWSVAKGYYQRGNALTAMRYYFSALFSGCYGVKFSMVVFLQIVLSAKNYRKMSDFLAKIGIKP